MAAWLATIASAKGPAHPQVRAALHALGTFMNGQGIAFPSLETLAVCAALHPRRVRLLVRMAEQAGWVTAAIERRGRRRGWRLKTYRIAYPAGVSPAGREDRMSSRQRDDVRIGAPLREDQACNDVRTPGPPKSPEEISRGNLRAGAAPGARAAADLDSPLAAIAEPLERISTRIAARKAKGAA